MSDHPSVAGAPSQLQRDIGKLMRGGYSYDQFKRLIAEARRGASLSPPERKKQGTPKRLTRSELEAFLEVAYERSGWRGLMMRTLFETGSRVGTFVGIGAVDIAFTDWKIRVTVRGTKTATYRSSRQRAAAAPRRAAERAALSLAPGRSLLEAAHPAGRAPDGGGRRDREARLPAPASAHRCAAPGRPRDARGDTAAFLGTSIRRRRRCTTRRSAAASNSPSRTARVSRRTTEPLCISAGGLQLPPEWKCR